MRSKSSFCEYWEGDPSHFVTLAADRDFEVAHHHVAEEGLLLSNKQPPRRVDRLSEEGRQAPLISPQPADPERLQLSRDKPFRRRSLSLNSARKNTTADA